jgi:dTDP-4-amino-4,6-dideoxygalactose transaminase
VRIELVCGHVRIPILDVVAQNKALSAEITAAIASVVESGRFILGPEVERFESSVCAHLGVRHAVAVSSGSDALVCALHALGVGAGDEVITTPFSFFATVEAILRVGAVPRFVDVCDDTLELDPEQVHAAVGPRTRAILGVELYGEPGRIERLAEVAERLGLPLIEDAAQAFGARFRGRAVGSFGALGCFSFQPTKPLGAFGDAGMVVTSDDRLAELCRQSRSHGATSKHRHAVIGGNYRMDALQAAVLGVKLLHLPGYLELRAHHARCYSRELESVPGLVPPPICDGSEGSHSVYTVRVKCGRRDALATALREAEIETAVHYPLGLHRQPALVERGLGLPAGSLPVAERAAGEVLALPVYPELADVGRERVCGEIWRFADVSAGRSS